MIDREIKIDEKYMAQIQADLESGVSTYTGTLTVEVPRNKRKELKFIKKMFKKGVKNG